MSDTRQKIREVALALFAKNGYEGTSMEQIAKGVGIKKSSLYAFIDNKEGLYCSVFEEAEKKYNLLVEKALNFSADMPPLDRLYYLFKEYVTFISQCVGEYGAFYLQATFFSPLSLREQLLARILENEMKFGARFEAIISDAMERGLIRKVPPETILLSYYSLREGLSVINQLFMPGVSEQEKLARIDDVWRQFLVGIKA